MPYRRWRAPDLAVATNMNEARTAITAESQTSLRAGGGPARHVPLQVRRRALSSLLVHRIRLLSKQAPAAWHVLHFAIHQTWFTLAESRLAAVPHLLPAAYESALGT